MIPRQINSEDLVIGMRDRLQMRRHGNDKRRNLPFPHRPDRNDIHDLAERAAITERPVLLFISDRQKRAIHTGMIAYLMTSYSLMYIRHFFPDLLIIIQDLMIILPNDKYPGGRYRI